MKLGVDEVLAVTVCDGVADSEGDREPVALWLGVAVGVGACDGLTLCVWLAEADSLDDCELVTDAVML